MKHIGCILEFTHSRNKELMQAYRSAIITCRHICLDDIADRIVNTPCSRFWVSEERATVVLTAIKQGKPVLDRMRPTKREMYEEINSRVDDFLNRNKSLSLFEGIVHVVNSPAPKFYMRPRCAMEIIYKMKRGYYDNFAVDNRNARERYLQYTL